MKKKKRQKAPRTSKCEWCNENIAQFQKVYGDVVSPQKLCTQCITELCNDEELRNWVAISSKSTIWSHT